MFPRSRVTLPKYWWGLFPFKLTNSLSLLVPENRDSEASAVIRLGFEVDLTNVLRAIERILIALLEGPPQFLHVPVDNIDRDDVFQSLQSADKKSAVSLETEWRKK